MKIQTDHLFFVWIFEKEEGRSRKKLKQKQGFDMFYLGFLLKTDKLSENSMDQIQVEIKKISYGYKNSEKIYNKNCSGSLNNESFSLSCFPKNTDWPLETYFKISDGIHPKTNKESTKTSHSVDIR